MITAKLDKTLIAIQFKNGKSVINVETIADVDYIESNDYIVNAKIHIEDNYGTIIGACERYLGQKTKMNITKGFNISTHKGNKCIYNMLYLHSRTDDVDSITIMLSERV